MKPNLGVCGAVAVPQVQFTPDQGALSVKGCLVSLAESHHRERQKHRQHDSVDDVDEECADDRHDQEGLRSRAVALGKRLHVGNCRRQVRIALP
jgi:hypothetical protein